MTPSQVETYDAVLWNVWRCPLKRMTLSIETYDAVHWSLSPRSVIFFWTWSHDGFRQCFYMPPHPHHHLLPSRVWHKWEPHQARDALVFWVALPIHQKGQYWIVQTPGSGKSSNLRKEHGCIALNILFCCLALFRQPSETPELWNAIYPNKVLQN